MAKRDGSRGLKMGARSAAEADSDTEEGLTEYEKKRAALIARNRARLLELGVVDAYQSFTESIAPTKKPAVKRRKKEPKGSTEPTRKSSRLQGAAASDETNELGIFVTNDECPRCGKVITRGHRRHLEGCRATRERQGGEAGALSVDDGDEESEESKPRKRRASTAKTQAAKLAELELSGLVDFDDSKAEFAVLGSTGSHYKVVFEKDGNGFGDGPSSCQCMDYRSRRHTCKHIRLVLKQLDVESDPGAWQQAIQSQLWKFQSPSKSGAPDEEAGEAKPDKPTRSQKRKPKAKRSA